MRNKNGDLLTLPNIRVVHEQKVICKHNVSIDGVTMEITKAVRYLLADRERILTELADIMKKIHHQ